VSSTRRTTAERITGGWRTFRSHSRYFQLKALVLALYGVASVATLVYVFAPRHLGRNSLSARITVLPGDPVMGRYFIVQNESRRDWVGVRFEIDGGYEQRKDAVLAGEKIMLYLRSFTRPGPAVAGAPGPRVAAPLNQPVSFLRIESQGRTTLRYLSE
jgi:hypothetical protein